MSHDRAILFDIAEASEQLLVFIKGHSRDELESDLLLRSAVLHQLMILGEAVRQLSSETKDKYPNIDWRGYNGLRNVLIHQYRRVDLDKIWTIVDTEVRALNREFRRFASDEEFA